MSLRLALACLDLTPEASTRDIRRRYRELLKLNRPEDNPEGFQQLRAAYEICLEFARQRESQGASPLRAVMQAARLRLRPILMTSLAFIMGTVPLVFASGAGAEMRHAMGIAVFSGMIGVTLFGLFLTPLFYLLLSRPRRLPAAQAATLEVRHA